MCQLCKFLRWWCVERGKSQFHFTHLALYIPYMVCSRERKKERESTFLHRPDVSLHFTRCRRDLRVWQLLNKRFVFCHHMLYLTHTREIGKSIKFPYMGKSIGLCIICKSASHIRMYIHMLYWTWAQEIEWKIHLLCILEFTVTLSLHFMIILTRFFLDIHKRIHFAHLCSSQFQANALFLNIW